MILRNTAESWFEILHSRLQRIPYCLENRWEQSKQDGLDVIYTAVLIAIAELSWIEALVQAVEQAARLAHDLKLVVWSEIPIILARMKELSQHKVGTLWSEPGRLSDSPFWGMCELW